MKVLLVNGSPHEKGCTFTALSEIADTLKEEGIDSEFFWIGASPLSGCLGCGGCRKSGCCVFDDSVRVFTEKAGDADGFVFGSPVHYAAASGAITSFMDRVFFSSGRRFFMKPAAAVVSARRAGTTAALDQLHKYFFLAQMPIVPSKYWNMVHGSTPDQVREDAEGMQNMRYLARNMAHLLKCLEAGKSAGIPLPGEEERVFTNFIR